jgi:NitT/TauT family transport system substrate-binding protein
LVDTRVPAQSDHLYGGAVPGNCLVTLGEVLRQYPHTCQAIAHGLAHALQWLRTAGPGDLIKAVPEAHMHGDRALYLAAFNKTRHSLSTDGLIPPDAPGHAHRVWARLGGVALVAPGDLAATYTNALARLAKARFRI